MWARKGGYLRTCKGIYMFCYTDIAQRKLSSDDQLISKGTFYKIYFKKVYYYIHF